MEDEQQEGAGEGHFHALAVERQDKHYTRIKKLNEKE